MDLWGACYISFFENSKVGLRFASLKIECDELVRTFRTRNGHSFPSNFQKNQGSEPAKELLVSPFPATNLTFGE